MPIQISMSQVLPKIFIFFHSLYRSSSNGSHLRCPSLLEKGRRKEAGRNVKVRPQEVSTGLTNTVDDSCLHFSHSKVTPLHRCFRNTHFLFAALSQAALSSGIGLFTKDRISSWCSSLMRPTAIASITQSASPTRTSIFFCPRMKCFSNPKLTSNLELTRSTAGKNRG